MSEVFTSTPHGRLNLENQHVNGCALDGESGVESSFNRVDLGQAHRALGRWDGTESRPRRAVQTSISLATSGFACGSC
jgi:hypothetical protein